MGNRRTTNRPRIEDVARLAGVTPSTVSRVLRQAKLVSPDTRHKVLEAVTQLNYVPNRSASGLASQRSGIAAVLLPSIGNFVFGETFRGISDSLAALGLQLLVGDYGYSDDRLRSLLHTLIGRDPEALVLVGLVRDPEARQLLKHLTIPIIETWDLSRNPVDVVVGFSNINAGRAVAKHLLKWGRRRLAFAGSLDSRAQARLRGLNAGFQAHKPGAHCYHAITTETSFRAGRLAMSQILSEAPSSDAVFFANDVLAVGGLIECERRGVRVPADMSIVGLGDLEISREMLPTLTTVRIPGYEIGSRSGDIIRARFAGEAKVPRVLDVGFTLIDRESG